MTFERIAKGRRGEELAAAFIRGLGMRIRHRNFRSPAGEIDIVAERDGGLVFVEVRTRGRSADFSPIDSVDDKKCRQVRRVVQAYLDAIGFHGQYDVRIDVIGVTLEPHFARLEHLPDAM